MDLTNNSALQAARERMREKMNGTLKTAKLQTSLASKIKSKNFNNSSVVKISLKHNNRALACALTAEKETSRRLESDKMILQKEVKMLHFQNAVLRQNLSIMNRMLKDIDALMKINLPAVIELSSIGESSDPLATEERKSEHFSHESSFSVDGLPGFRLTGVALRVPSSSIEQQKCSNDPGDLLDEDEHLIAPQSTDSSTAEEKFDGQHEIEMHSSLLAANDHHSTCNTNVTWNSFLNMEVNSLLPLEEDMISNGKSGGFVTQRRKRSTASFSSTQSVNSDFNRSKNSLGIGRESCCNTQWRINNPGNLSPEPGHLAVTGENALHFDFVMGKDMLEMSCSPLSNQDNFDAKNENKDTLLDMETTHQPDLVHSGGCNVHPIVERPVEQEKTVYEADMEMTSSDSAAIVAVMPKRKTKTSKSSIPVKQDRVSLRKVRTTAHDKTKRSSSCKGKESSMTSKSEVKMEVPSNTNENISLEFKPSADFRQDSADRYNSLRTYVFPGPAMNDKAKAFESENKPYSAKYQAKPSVFCSVEESFTENIPLEIQPPANFGQDLADQYNNRRTYVLPGPANKANICESKTKLYPGKNEAKPSVVCDVQESFTETTYVCNANSDLISTVENLPSSNVEHSTNDIVVKKRKSKLVKRPAKDIVNAKKKRKITTNLGEAQDNHRSDELDSAKIDATAATFQIKNQPCTRRETYVLSSAKPNCMLSEFIPKYDGTNCRRETFVIPEPNRLIPLSVESAETPDHPLQSLKSAVSKDVQLKTEGVIDTKKTDSNIDSHDLDTDFKKPFGLRKSKCKETNQNKKSLNLFSQVDKRKTRVLATNQNDFSNNQGALVRESCVNATQFHSNKPTKLLNAVTENEHDSFMLDMVSESILDSGSLDSPSFVEFPSTANLETPSMHNVSLNNFPLLDSPLSDEHDTMENKQLNASKSLDVFDENGLAQETFEADNQHCKIENQSIEINEADVKPFQDLTNKTRDLTKQSSKSCSEDQEEEQVHTRRRRNPVNYKEPSLGTKLRREDSCTDTEFLNPSVAKGKRGRKGGSKKKKIESEECPTKSM